MLFQAAQSLVPMHGFCIPTLVGAGSAKIFMAQTRILINPPHIANNNGVPRHELTDNSCNP